MSIAIIAPSRDVTVLRDHLRAALPEVSVDIYPEIATPQDVRMAVLWNQPPHSLEQFPKLGLMQSLGAGVDHILSDEYLRANIPVTRVVDPQLNIGMCRYVTMAVLNFHKNLYQHLRAQQARKWTGQALVETPVRVGILGMGVLGRAVAESLLQLEFEVHGFSNRPKEIPGVQSYSAEKNELGAFLAHSNCLVCLLPLTPQTRGILNLDLFRKMPAGAFLINVGRGAHLVEADLLRALEEGELAGACLDVLEKEPLPPEHPFWTHPGIVLTPHIASVTDQQTAAQQMAENYRRLLRGGKLINEVDRKRGY